MLSRRGFALGGLATASLCASDLAGADPASDEDHRLLLLFKAIGRQEDALDPLGAIYRGAPPDVAAFLKLYSPAQTRAERALAQTALGALARINRARLSPPRQISYDVFLADQRERVFWLRPEMVALTQVRPFNHFGGLHIDFPSIVSKGGPLRYASETDYRRNLAFIAAFAQVLETVTGQFRQGLASGVVESRLTISNMIAQLDGILAQPADQSPLTSAIRDFPEALGPQAREHLSREFVRTVEQEIYPAYRRFRDFLADEYLPAAREAPGLSAMKGGAALYRAAIKLHTTLPLDPDQVHRIGLAEVARIQGEMEQVKRRIGFGGSLAQFFNLLRTDPRFHPKSPAELGEGFARVARAVDAKVPQFFRRIPKARLQIQPYPAYREKFEAGGSYNQGSVDGSRPGVFFYNTYDLPSRFLTGITTLYLHEGAPGHHFQISLALEDSSLPDFQRFGGNNAFVEGWALYAESLGYAMGLYQDPLQHWGTLDDEMLRAMRLVVDTAIHAKGWSREQAIAYMLANSGMGKSDATAEVDRYIAWPAQALGYKIGALTIQRLRKKSEDAWGRRFDIRDFHDQVLGSGALPLTILEAKIDRWIAGRPRLDSAGT